MRPARAPERAWRLTSSSAVRADVAADPLACPHCGGRGCRFSESLNTVKDVAEESISKDYDSLIKDTAKSVKRDMSHEFSSYGHNMWDLK